MTKTEEIKADNPYMQIAIQEALNGILKGHGGPFGSVIVKDNKIIAKGHNMVLKNNDSTAHGEIITIRKAEKKIRSHDLRGAILYTTGEPCPMCLAACLWANIEKIYYGCTIADNAEIGFRDELFYDKFGGMNGFTGYLEEMDREACLQLFKKYKSLNATKY